jgi:FdhE protein
MSRDALGLLRRDHPEWRPWLALLERARAAAGDTAWDDAVAWEPRTPYDDRPALAEATITVDRRTADRWWRTLVSAAEGPAAPLARVPADAIELLDAAVGDDGPRLEALAAVAGVRLDTIRAVAGLAAMPILHACRRRVVRPAWPRGCCPVCGAWPTLAEARGLERTRHGRCAPCGSDWLMPWLQCPFCGNDDHTRLHALVPEATGEARKVEACAICHGYLKTLMTLSTAPPADVSVLDLATVDLDVAALSEGYTRPLRAETPLDARVIARKRGRMLAWLG